MSVETQIISILLNRPNDKNLININPDWFTYADYKWIFETIYEHQDELLDPLAIYGFIKTKHPSTRMDMSSVVALKEEFVTDTQLDHLVIQLHRNYLINQLRSQMQLCQQAPIDENLQKVAQTIDQLGNLRVIKDDGSIDPQLDALVNSLDKPQPTGIRTIPALDHFLAGGLYGGMLFTIGARPSVGKTAFCVDLSYLIAQQDPEIQVDYFTLEMSKRELVNRFVSREAGVNSVALKNPFPLADRQKKFVKISAQKYRRRQIRVYDRTPNLSDVLTIIKRHGAKAKPNKYVAIIDHLGLLKVPGNDERYLQVGEITRDLKIAANEYDIPIIELSQLNRAISNRQDKRPMLTDLRESGSIEQDSNVVAFLYNPSPDDRNIKCLSIQKNREGPIGDIYMGFIPGKMSFKVVPKEELA